MSESGFKRSQRVAHVLQQELGRLLIDGLKDPRVGFVTVTEVRPTPDLKLARVYVSIYGTPEERATSLEALREASGYLKRELGQRVHLRFIPHLEFHHDDSLDRAARLDVLLNAIQQGEAEAPEDTAPPTAPVQTTRTDLRESADRLSPPSPEPPSPKPSSRRRRSRRSKPGK